MNNDPDMYQTNRDSIGADESRTWAILAHLSTAASTIFSAGWLGFVGPLLIWLFFRDKSMLVRKASARSFNFALALWIISMIAWICFFTIILFPVAIILWVVGFILSLWSPIRAAMAANRGDIYRYPFSIPILH